MAATTITVAKNGSRVLTKILARLFRGSSVTTEADKKSVGLNIDKLNQRVWISDGIPNADAGVSTGGAAPIKMGDLVYRPGSDYSYVCVVGATVNTAAGVNTAVFRAVHTNI